MQCLQCGSTSFDESGRCAQCGSAVIFERRAAEPLGRPSVETEGRAAVEVRWGGFWRRLIAFSLDSIVLAACSVLFVYVLYAGYRLGLFAHGRSLRPRHLAEFLRLLSGAWLCLVAGYFVLFHGMEGRTIGKWLLGLRVVGEDRQPITYGQALMRCGAYVTSLVFGLGFFWVLFQREKRGWHDLLAGTWVVREDSVREPEG